MTEKKSDDVIGKLGKVADTLESATTNLSNVVTQQQLDVARERISKCESDLQSIQSKIDINVQSREENLEDLNDKVEQNKKHCQVLERDLSGLRALALSSFIVSIVGLVGVVLCITRL